MSTEVLQTDYAIRDIVPGEPMTYHEAVERAIAEEQSRRGSEDQRQREAAWSATRCSG